MGKRLGVDVFFNGSETFAGSAMMGITLAGTTGGGGGRESSLSLPSGEAIS